MLHPPPNPHVSRLFLEEAAQFSAACVFFALSGLFRLYIYVIYRAGGPYGKNCARGLEYGPRPKAEGSTQDQGHSFSHTDRPSPVNNMFIFFLQ